ncbi:MAG: ATP-binding protein [Enterocloster bolteae]
MIANAVAHRIYLDPVNIQVALYDNRLEITSPGMLMNGVTIEKMKEGYSKIRNRAIANAFSYMKIIEKWDSGIPRIIRECQEYGIPEPELIDFDGDFRINMYRQPSLIQAGTIGTNSGTIGTINGIKVTSPEERVLTIMKQNARVTQKELQKELGVSLRTVKRMIAELQDKGYIVRRGNNRSGDWIVKG